ncbi:hypothetical protein KM043_007149 [Ampulex compressa]|nr:hypothetical protein KM043_007149 [Ampulex compressa]
MLADICCCESKRVCPVLKRKEGKYLLALLFTAVLIMEPSLVRLDCLMMLEGLFIRFDGGTGSEVVLERARMAPFRQFPFGLEPGGRWGGAPHRPTTPA